MALLIQIFFVPLQRNQENILTKKNDKMKANKETLVAVLNVLAKAHNATFNENHLGTGDFAVNKYNVPVYTDVRLVADAFFGTQSVVYCSLGSIAISLNEADFLDEVKMPQLRFCLPHGEAERLAEKYA